MTIGDIKLRILANMREYTNGGVEVDDVDYNASVVPLINQYAMEVATVARKLEKIYRVSQFNPTNLLGDGYWLQNATHSTTDVSYTATGAQAFSFEIADYATVYVEEETSEDTWTTLITYTKTLTQLTKVVGVTTTTTTLSGDRGFINVKGKTGVSDTANDIRIRFSGSYTYAYRFVALFEELFYSDSECPAYIPYVPYALPSGFYQLNKVDVSEYDRQVKEYTDYKWEKSESGGHLIKLPYDDDGEFTVYYWAYPTAITVPDLDDLDAQDSTELELAEEAIPALTYFVAAALLNNENDDGLSDSLRQQAYIAMNNLEVNNAVDKSDVEVINVSNW